MNDSRHARPTRIFVFAALLGSCAPSKGGDVGASDDAGATSDGPSRDGLGFDAAPTCTAADCDGDGYPRPIDCDDFDPLINPEAYDFPGDGVDDDCDGTVDDPVVTCESVPASPPGTPTDFARAADLCPQHATTSAGVPFDPLVRAAWGEVKGQGPASQTFTSTTKPEVQTNIVSSFGANAPRTGLTMFGLSNGPWGTATPRDSAPLDPSTFKLTNACADIPLLGQDCDTLSNGQPAGGLSVQDWAELTLWVQVPSNAKAMQFDFSFFTTEFNQFWSSSLNDAFFVLATSANDPTLAGQNVAKGANGLGITVNSGFFEVCTAPPGPDGLSPEKAAAIAQCVGVAGDATKRIFGTLEGTGYDGKSSAPFDGTATSTDGTKKYVYGGGTGWLRATFATKPRDQIQLRFIVHDTFDGLKDSAVLVDAITWQKAEPQGGGGVGRPPR